MRSSWTQTSLMVAGALVIVLSSFFITLQVLDYWSPVQPASMQPPAYNDAALEPRSNARLFQWSEPKRIALRLVRPRAAGSVVGRTSAFIGFVVGHGATVSEAVLRAGVFFAPPSLPQQTLQVWSEGVKLADYRLGTPDAEIKIPLLGIANKAGAPIILGFYLPTAIAPHAISSDSSDSRPLGLFLKSLKLMP